MAQPLNAHELRSAIECGAFDPDFYLAHNPDVARSGRDPLGHYLAWGQKEGRRPSRDFCPSEYLMANPDLAETVQDGFAHYIRFGWREGRPRSPAEAFGRTPKSTSAKPVFTSAPPPPAEATLGASPALRRKEIEESGLFDPNFYRNLIPWLDGRVDPLNHYLSSGHRAFLDPSRDFSASEYYALHPDVRRAGVNALLHYLDHGRRENRRLTFTARDEHKARTGSFATGAEPQEEVSLESMRGAAYLFRHRFVLEKTSSLEQANRAIDVLAHNPCRLKIESQTPDASIVIPVYGQLQVLLNCLDSLAAQTSRYTAEVIVVDDASPTSSRVAEVARIPWLRYLAQQKNTGFVGACNFGAAAARGKHIVLLNNDTRVVAHWLDELIGSFSLFPKAGLVGSKLINDDETLQEAGGIVWQNGEVWNFGRGDYAFRPQYCYARKVDYCSAASIAVTTESWRKVGGFDEIYAPAYCEDTDLAFRLREAGYETWLQPLSLVIHYEGKSHGKDLTTGIKAGQVKNLETFYARWSTQLKHRRTAMTETYADADSVRPQRILVLDAMVPTPDRDSGSVTTIEMIRLLMDMKWNVSFAPGTHEFAGEYTKSLQRRGIEVLIGPCIGNVDDIIETRPNIYDAILAFRCESLIDCVDKLRAAYPKAPIVFHTMDLHYLRLSRKAEITRNRSLQFEAELMKDKELELIAKSDCAIVVSSSERDLIGSEIPGAPVVVYPYTIDVKRSCRRFEDRRHLCFIGGFKHEPNVDAVLHFMHDIWPLLAPHLPVDAKLLIVGPDAPLAIRDLASDRVEVTGHIHDLDGILDTCRLSIVPLRYGAGIKGKLVRTLARGLPSVTSTVAVEGMGLEPGRQVLVADDPPTFAEATLRVFRDEETWHRLQEEGYAFAESCYSRERSLQLCEHIFEIACETWISRRRAARRKRLAELLTENNPIGKLP